MTCGHLHGHRARSAAASCVVAAAAAFAAGGWFATHAAADQSISITNGGCTGGGSAYCFTPEAVTVPVGTPVTWMNSSSAPQHTATLCTSSACSGAPANTGSDSFNVSVGSSPGSFTFTSAGTYTYYCTVHGYAAMHGTITVTAASSTPTPSSSSGASASPTAPATGVSTGAISASAGLFVAGIGLVITVLTLTIRRRGR